VAKEHVTTQSTTTKDNQMLPTKEATATVINATKALTHARRAAGLLPRITTTHFVDIVDSTESELTQALSCIGIEDAANVARAARRDGALTRTAVIIVRALESMIPLAQRGSN
jgi:hypothetical protein